VVLWGFVIIINTHHSKSYLFFYYFFDVFGLKISFWHLGFGCFFERRRRGRVFERGTKMANGVERELVVLFSEEELREMSGVKRGEEYIEVTCGCTSHRYGDAVGRLRVFINGELEITCECTPGCDEGLFFFDKFLSWFLYPLFLGC
jgi:hypothetical protein